MKEREIEPPSNDRFLRHVQLDAFFGTILLIGTTRFDISVMSFVLLLGVFIIDATYTILLRASRKEKIWLAHNQHLYQRFVKTGLSHSKVCINATVFMLICSVLATLSLIHRDMIPWFMAIELILFLGILLLLHRAEQKLIK